MFVFNMAFVVVQQVNGDGLSLALSSTELDTLKADILKEIRSEIQKVKQEIIEGESRYQHQLFIHPLQIYIKNFNICSYKIRIQSKIRSATVWYEKH